MSGIIRSQVRPREIGKERQPLSDGKAHGGATGRRRLSHRAGKAVAVGVGGVFHLNPRVFIFFFLISLQQTQANSSFDKYPPPPSATTPCLFKNN